jgi:beta-galactosidase/beta-glucuronidase
MSATHLSTDPHPRPQLERDGWVSLNGVWAFAIDSDATLRVPEEVDWDQQITVPFSPECRASGIEHRDFFKACWYMRKFRGPTLVSGERLLIHFGAVDYEAKVWINGRKVIIHTGGNTPFSADITNYLIASELQTVVVRAEDDPHDLAKPRGKQDWQLQPHSIWYPRTSGIWQTVWLERVPAVSIATLRWTSSLERWEIGLDVRLRGHLHDGLRLAVHLSVGDTLLADDSYTIVAGEIHRRISLSDPGIDDYRNELLWSPAKPTLIQAQLEVQNAGGTAVDRVRSYTALRSIGVQGDRFVLNGQPFSLRMILDQGYWPETGLTPPNDEALRLDVELVKAMGFNGVRKHQKIESPGYLYWADVMGLLVWEEMPSAYRFNRISIERLTQEWMEVIARDASHPCIVAWVPFNESWGVPDLPDSPAQRHYVQALYHLTKTLDPTRPVVGNDGWESVATDIIGVHDYDSNPDRIAQRYGAHEMLPRLFKRERPGGRMLLIGEGHIGDQPVMLTEFGGITYSTERESTWGYSRVDTSEALAEQYTRLLEAVRSATILTGFCYTQFTDTYQEANGLLFADRQPKIPIEQIRKATRGAVGRGPLEAEWRERLMQAQRTQYLVPAEDHRTYEDR